MKKFTKIAIVGIIIIAGIFAFAWTKQQNRITYPGAETETQIIFPMGGESLIKGKTYTLKWFGGPEPIAIFLIDTSLKPEGASSSTSDRIYNIKNIGAYDYQIPETLKDGIYEFYIGNNTSKTFRISQSN